MTIKHSDKVLACRSIPMKCSCVSMKHSDEVLTCAPPMNYSHVYSVCSWVSKLGVSLIFISNQVCINLSFHSI